jgi:hypothetical protein
MGPHSEAIDRRGFYHAPPLTVNGPSLITGPLLFPRRFACDAPYWEHYRKGSRMPREASGWTMAAGIVPSPACFSILKSNDEHRSTLSCYLSIQS